MKIFKVHVLQILFTFAWVCLSISAWAATTIYRSVGPGNAAALDSGSMTHTLGISSPGSVATISGAPLPDNVGVGDVFYYNGGASVAFICGRVSGNQFHVQNSAGQAAEMTAGADTGWSVYRAYTSLANVFTGSENVGLGVNFDNWDGTTQGNFLASNLVSMAIACYADAIDTTPALMPDNWETDATYIVKIYTPISPAEVGASQRHTGKWGGGYCLQTNGGSAAAVRVVNCNVWIEGLRFDIRNAGLSNRSAISIENQAAPILPRRVWVDQNIFRGSGTTSAQYHCGIQDSSTTSSVQILAWDNIFYNFQGAGAGLNGGIIAASAYGSTIAAYNNTFNNCEFSINNIIAPNGNFVSAINNISQATANGFGGVFTTALLSRDNLSNLSSPPPGSNPISDTTLAFRDIGNSDFHLAAADTAAIAHGISLSGAGELIDFQNDIDLETRPGGPWSIGADEYSALPTATPTQTPTFTQTSAASPTASPTNVPGALHSPTVTMTPTMVQTLTPTPVASGAGSSPGLEIAFPNPARGPVVTFSAKPEPGEAITIQVFSATYKRIWQTTVTGVPNRVNQVAWNCSGIPPGIYLYRIETGNRKSAFKKLAIIK